MSLSASRVPALFPRQCGNNASKSAGAGKLLFVTFLSDTHAGTGEQARGAGAGRYIDSPPPPPPPLPWPRGDWRDLNPPHNDQPAAALRRSATPTTLLSPSFFLTHRSPITADLRSITLFSSLPLDNSCQFWSPRRFITRRFSDNQERASFTGKRENGFTFQPWFHTFASAR